MSERYVYSIEMEDSKVGDIFQIFTDNIESEKNNQLPLLFKSKGGNVYLILHGTKDGKFSVFDREYTIEEIVNLYKFPTLGMKSRNLNIISCYGSSIETFYDPLGINARSAIPSSHKVKTGIASNGVFKILTKEECQIPEDLKSDIKFCGSREFRLTQ